MPTPEQNAFLRGLGIDIDDADVATNAAAAPAAGTVGAPPKGPNEPDLTPEQRTIAINVDGPVYRAAYDAALQGASGKFSDAQKATELAQSIAEEAAVTNTKRLAELPQQRREAFQAEYEKFFLEALQGLAGGNDGPSAVVAKSHAMSLQSLNVQDKEIERLEWREATLPQRIAPDCEIVRGKVPGPKNFVLCKTHGHVMDTNLNMVIAHTVDEFKAMKGFH